MPIIPVIIMETK